MKLESLDTLDVNFICGSYIDNLYLPNLKEVDDIFYEDLKSFCEVSKELHLESLIDIEILDYIKIYDTCKIYLNKNCYKSKYVYEKYKNQIIFV